MADGQIVVLAAWSLASSGRLTCFGGGIGGGNIIASNANLDQQLFKVLRPLAKMKLAIGPAATIIDL